MEINELRKKYPLKPCLKVLQVSRNQYYYWRDRVKEDRDANIKEAIRQISEKYPYYGYRRIHVELKRQGIKINHKKTLRIYREMALQLSVRNKRPRKLSKESFTKELTEAKIRNDVWAEDFLKSYLESGRGFRIYIAIDIKTRYVVGWKIDYSIRSADVIEVLKEAFERNGRPRFVRSDNGPEFRAKEMKRFLFNERVGQEFIEGGKPYQNGYAETLVGKIKKEFFNRYRFDTIEEARKEFEKYVEYYNNERPHQSLNYKTPKEVSMAYTNSLLMHV
jgi:putative transposase